MNDKRIQGWTQLCDLVFDYRKSGHWLFRGERNPNNPLRPRIGRPDSRKTISDGENRPYDPTQEALMIDYFTRAARPHVRYEPKTRLEWLAIAQHHGMATRLLDWTESLLVAAFFAVWKAVSGDSPVVYAVKDLPITDKDAKKQDDLDALEDGSVYYPPHISPNIAAQRSVFTVHRKPDQIFVPAQMERLILGHENPRTAPITYRLNLDACGINTASLFPDVHGLAEYISWLYKWGRLPPTI